jgi:uncharacterized protein YyaL (SSP411 family)
MLAALALTRISASGAVLRRATIAVSSLVVLAGGSGRAVRGIALMEDRERDEPTAFVCRAYVCDAPTSDPAELTRQLKGVVAGVE